MQLALLLADTDTYAFIYTYVLLSWRLSSAAAMPERINNFQGQSFHKLRRACLRRGALFKDPLFPPAAQSLFYKRELPPGLTWKRPRVSDIKQINKVLVLHLCVSHISLSSDQVRQQQRVNPGVARINMLHFHQIGLIKALSIIGEASCSESWALGEQVGRAADGLLH